MERKAVKKLPHEYEPWTKEEIAFVLNNYGPMTAAQLSAKLPGRSVIAIRRFVKRFDEARGAR